MNINLIDEMLKVMSFALIHFSHLRMKCAFTCLSSSTVILAIYVLILLLYNSVVLTVHCETVLFCPVNNIIFRIIIYWFNRNK